VRRDEALRILRDHREELRAYGVKHLALFGSVARDEAGPDSDVDILVEFDGPATFDGYMGLKFLLEERFGRAVDVVTRGALKPRLAPRVEREALYVA
jgi:predicted nucleotidyltransferase